MSENPRVSKFDIELGKTVSIDTQYPIQVEIETLSGDVFSFTVAGQTVFTYTKGRLRTDIANLTINILEESVPKGPKPIE